MVARRGGPGCRRPAPVRVLSRPSAWRSMCEDEGGGEDWGTEDDGSLDNGRGAEEGGCWAGDEEGAHSLLLDHSSACEGVGKRMEELGGGTWSLASTASIST